MITKREAAIISAYTGITLGNFGDMHAYAEVLERPIWTHEFASQTLCDQLKERARQDFITLDVAE